MTFNEPAVFAFLGHADGIHAPGLRDWPTAIRVADNELRAHAGATQAIRALVQGVEGRHGDRRQPGRAGDGFGAGSARRRASGAPLATRGSSIRSSAGATRRWGSRPTARRATSTGVDLAEPPAGDLDYLGLNYYRRDSVSARSDRAFDWDIGAVAGSEQTQMDWHVAPDGLRDTSDRAEPDLRAARDRGHRERRRVPRHRRSRTAGVRDADRLDYLARHVAAAAEALGRACR